MAHSTHGNTFYATFSEHGNAPNAASLASGTRNSDAAALKHYKAMRFVIARARAADLAAKAAQGAK